MTSGTGSRTQRCPSCGTEMEAAATPLGLCPNCLLELALDVTSLETEQLDRGDAPTVVMPEETFVSGQIQGERYRIRSLLGRGGMGEVWRAYDLKLRQDVALKALRTEQLEDRGALEMLRQEVRVAREVISPNVCRVFDLQEVDGQELVSMEYIDGTTLAEILEERSPLELDEAREIASQFLAGLEAVHDAGLVHRDIKPENIMITRTGRVVVMDFGIAKALQEGKGTFAGTPAYMSPEQSRAGELDARSDVFSAGVVLAEMVAPGGVRTRESRKKLLEGLHQEVPRVEDSPWAGVIRRAIAGDPNRRFERAASVARALEEVTLRALGDETARPYPGLAAFQEEDARFFFGRELEVEALWKRLRRPHLFAVIGPSGAGKSSFLRAGLLPTLGEEWQAIVATPGPRPFAGLARRLAAELEGDVETVDSLLRSEETDVAIEVIRAWRERRQHALVVVDQFEELFTQSPVEVQRRFTALLARLPLEADVHALLSMRDDFLFHCYRFEGLRPILADLTLLGPPTGASLRRAIVEPALSCGYRFEDESIVEEMLGEVEGERGALPMVAFAAARLWEERDRESGLLSSEAYERIGGVGGALAQHAEETLEGIGEDRIPIVRELLRNLVTAEGTRAARDREDLLSVFEGHDPDGDRFPAEEVLNALVDARLLTAYEVGSDGGVATHRVEIVHESLLSAWPRLVQWQAQDMEGALLRDQLRQAAQMWEERGQPADLLWTSTSLREYELWRERYPGGLSATEERFVAAMIARAERNRRRKRAVLTVVVAVLAIGLGVVGFLWRQAEAETRRAEASKLLALAQLEVETFPTGALAYYASSLELEDTPQARLAALRILQRGPVARILDGTPGGYIQFSPEGRWMAKGPQIFSIDGQPKTLDPSGQGHLRFSADGKLLFRFKPGPSTDVRIFNGADSIERWKLPGLRALPPVGLKDGPIAGNPTLIGVGLFSVVDLEGGVVDVSLLPAESMGEEKPEPSRLGRLTGWPFDYWVDPSGRWLAGLERGAQFGRRSGQVRLFLRPFVFGDGARARELAKGVSNFGFSPQGELLAVQDGTSDDIVAWDLANDPVGPRLIATGSRSPGARSRPVFSDDLSRLAMVSTAESSVYLWDLELPLDRRPTVVPTKALSGAESGEFHPGGRWLATDHANAVAFWPVEWPSARVLDPHEDPGFSWIGDFAFSPDSKWIASCSNQSGLHLWPLQAGLGSDRVVPNRCLALAFNATSSHVVTSRHQFDLERVAIDASEPAIAFSREAPIGGTQAIAVEATRRAVSAHVGTDALVVWDLAGGESREIDLMAGCRGPDVLAEATCRVSSLVLLADGSLWSGGESGVRRWDIDSGEAEWVVGPDPVLMTDVRSSPEGRHLLIWVVRQGESAESTEGATGTAQESEIRWRDLESGEERTVEGLPAEGIEAVALNPGGDVLAVVTGEGALWLRRVSGGEPHLLLGPEERMREVIFSPDGRWVAGRSKKEIWIWPVPDLDQPPFHRLSLNALLARIESLTNVRAVEDPEAASGWKLEIGPFPGWAEVPTW